MIRWAFFLTTICISFSFLSESNSAPLSNSNPIVPEVNNLGDKVLLENAKAHKYGLLSQHNPKAASFAHASAVKNELCVPAALANIGAKLRTTAHLEVHQLRSMKTVDDSDVKTLMGLSTAAAESGIAAGAIGELTKIWSKRIFTHSKVSEISQFNGNNIQIADLEKSNSSDIGAVATIEVFRSKAKFFEESKAGNYRTLQPIAGHAVVLAEVSMDGKRALFIDSDVPTDPSSAHYIFANLSEFAEGDRKGTSAQFDKSWTNDDSDLVFVVDQIDMITLRQLSR